MTVLFSLASLILLGMGLTCFSRRRIEETLPLALFTEVLWMYGFGLFGMLRPGAYLFLAASSAAGIVGLVHRARAGQLKACLKQLITPALLILLALAALSLQSVYARESSLWDELTHWADTVRAMFYTGHLGSAPVNNQFFPEYPPAMSLFQYLAVVTASWSYGGEYVEYPIYFAYFMACAILTMPFLKRLEFRKPLMILPAAAMVFVLPLLFDHNAYSVVYIEGFMGVMAGFCAAWAFMMDDSSRLDRLTMFGALAMLTLLKPAALLFSLVISLFAAIRVIRDRPGKAGILQGLSYPAWTLLIQLTWKISCSLGGMKASMGTLSAYGALFTGKLPSASAIAGNFMKRLTSPMVLLDEFGEANRTLLPAEFYPSIALLIVIMVLLVLMMARATGRKHTVWLTVMTGTLWILFIGGTLLSYICVFSEKEGMALASFDRYMEMLPVMTVFILFALASAVKLGKAGIASCAALVLLTAAFFPVSSVYHYAVQHQSYRQRSWDVHSKWQGVSTALQGILTADGASADDTKILAVMIDDSGAGGYAMHNLMRPWWLDFLVVKPENVSAEQLEDWAGRYDYVIPIALEGIAGIDEEHQQAYGGLFEDGYMINAVPYRVVRAEDGSVMMKKFD